MASPRPEQRGPRRGGAGKKAMDPAELQARLDWLLSDGDPWADLEEEPPCFCTAHLVHGDMQAVRAHLSQALPEIRTVHQSESPAYAEFEWPEESFAWAEWLVQPESFRGAGEITLGEGFLEIWTPTRSRMRKVLRLLMDLEGASVEVRQLAVEDPLAGLAPMLEEGADEDLNPNLDPEDLEFLAGFDGGEPPAWNGEIIPDLDDPWSAEPPFRG